MPDGYAANIRRCVDVDGCKVSGLKSHDYHVILQKLLPFVVRDILPDQVALPLIQLSRFFDSVCSKDIDVTEMQELSKSIAKTLCRLEMIFPPAFFDIMMHLPVILLGRLNAEALLAIGGCIELRGTYVHSKDM